MHRPALPQGITRLRTWALRPPAGLAGHVSRQPHPALLESPPSLHSLPGQATPSDQATWGQQPIPPAPKHWSGRCGHRTVREPSTSLSHAPLPPSFPWHSPETPSKPTPAAASQGAPAALPAGRGSTERRGPGQSPPARPLLIYRRGSSSNLNRGADYLHRQITRTLGFSGHVLSVAASPLCYCSSKAVTDNNT